MQLMPSPLFLSIFLTHTDRHTILLYIRGKQWNRAWSTGATKVETQRPNAAKRAKWWFCVVVLVFACLSASLSHHHQPLETTTKLKKRHANLICVYDLSETSFLYLCLFMPSQCNHWKTGIKLPAHSRCNVRFVSLLIHTTHTLSLSLSRLVWFWLNSI